MQSKQVGILTHSFDLHFDEAKAEIPEMLMEMRQIFQIDFPSHVHVFDAMAKEIA